MIVVGVDPGKEGAIVRLLDGVPVEIAPMPLLRSAKGRDEYDVPGIQRELLLADHMFIEKLQSMPLEKGGTIAHFNRGFCNGLFVGLCSAVGRPFTMVAPKTWQKVMLAGTPGEDTKQRSIMAAQRLFPGVDLRRTPRCTKLSDGISDALLLAEFGRRQLAGEVSG